MAEDKKTIGLTEGNKKIMDDLVEKAGFQARHGCSQICLRSSGEPRE
jgi:hypothetical protein